MKALKKKKKRKNLFKGKMTYFYEPKFDTDVGENFNNSDTEI